MARRSPKAVMNPTFAAEELVHSTGSPIPMISQATAVATAAKAGLRVRSVEYNLGSVAGAALHADGYAGRAGLLINEETNTVVGFTAVGPDVAELTHAATIAIAGEVPLDRLWHAVPAYPTISEVWLRLLETAAR